VADVFISHAYSDREAAERLAKALRARGLSVFRVPSMLANLRPNQRWHARVYDELDDAGVVLAVFSYRASGRPWMIAEASIAEFQGKLISLSLEPQATPGPLAHTEFAALPAQALAPRYGFFGPSRAEEDLDRLALAIRDKLDAAQAERLGYLQRLQQPAPVMAGSPEGLADALPFGFGAQAGSPSVEARRSAFVAAVRSLEQASNPDVSAAARAFVADGPRADSVARLYSAVLRERQPLAWRRFGEAALPHGVYAALAGLERAGLSQRQINERIAPQTSAGLLRARFGDRLFDSVGAAAFVALIALVGSLVATQALQPSPLPSPTASAALPPLAEASRHQVPAADRLELPSQAPTRAAAAPRPATPAAPADSAAMVSTTQTIPAPPSVRAAPAAAQAPLPRTPATAPEARNLEATFAEATGPEARGPEARGPEARGPEARGPEARGPEATGPETTGGACPSGPLTGAATIIVARGDTLSKIALVCYGEASAWRSIMQCNPQLGRRNQSGVSPLAVGDLIYVGDRLVLPAPGGPCPA
jgi:nucleoid-associated protein YgaU